MPDRTARPTPSPEPPPAWLLTPDTIGAIRRDDRLLSRLGRGERPDLDDPDPATRALAAWLLMVVNGGAR